MTRTLTELKPSPPSTWYYDPAHYEHELEAIWYRDWVCVGRTDSLQSPGDFFTAQTGDQNIIVVQVSRGEIRDWHNSCRHRVDWLLPDSIGDVSTDIIEQITGLARPFIRQDGQARRLNQQGLRSSRFKRGVLMPQEYLFWDFHRWLRARLGDPIET